jgi:UrcA family protein
VTTTKAQFPSRIGAAVAAVAAVAVTAIAAGVRSEPSAAQPRSVKVAYAGLDLSQPVGAQLLYHRLQQASSSVCGWLDQVDIAAYMRWQRCYDGALQRAVLQINAPELLAVYREDAGHSRSVG